MSEFCQSGSARNLGVILFVQFGATPGDAQRLLLTLRAVELLGDRVGSWDEIQIAHVQGIRPALLAILTLGPPP